MITEADEAALLARGATVHEGRASIRVSKNAYGDKLFWMEGPSGVLGLLVDDTSLEVLNVHWASFVSDPLNSR